MIIRVGGSRIPDAMYLPTTFGAPFITARHCQGKFGRPMDVISIVMTIRQQRQDEHDDL